jgi:hypothetical protein
VKYNALYERDEPPVEHHHGDKTFYMGKGVQQEVLASNLETARQLAELGTPEGHTLRRVEWTPESWTPGLVIGHIAGMTPVQGEGTVNGLPFYFRARGRHYSFSVAATPDADPVAVGFGDGEPGYHVRHPWGDEPFAAGFMSFEVAERLINECARSYLATLTGNSLRAEKV